MTEVPAVSLNSTGLKISKLGFGTVYFGVPSLCIDPEEGGRILVESHKMGVSFWDTSDDYGSHPHVASALRSVPREEVFISTKTSDRSGEGAKESLKRSLGELATDYLDAFFLHAVEYNWLTGCRQVLKELAELKKAGTVKAIGLSTHSVAVVREASRFEELDVIMTVCCRAKQAVIDRYPDRIPLEDGSIEDMFSAIEMAHSRGKGVIAMKVLGTSTPPLARNYRSSIKAVAGLDFVDAMVIGMRSLSEVEKNVRAILAA